MRLKPEHHLLLTVILLINIISSLLILIFSNPTVFTEKGLQEYYKLKELENFINDFSNLSILEHVDLYIKNGYDSKEAIKKVSHERKLNKNEVYREYHK